MSDLVDKLRISLKEIMGIRKGEVALIVYDEYAKDVCDITGKALEREGVTVYEYLLPESQRPLMSTPDDLTELLGMARPDLVFNQMKGIAEETPFRIGLHCEESMDGARVGHSPDIDMSMIEHAMTADFKDIKKKAEKLKKRFHGVNTVRVTTAAGTDISFNIEGRGFSDDLSIKKGRAGNLPAGEIWCAPVEHSMNGKIVCDGSIGDLGRVKEPLIIMVKNGRIESLESLDAEMSAEVDRLIHVDDDASLVGEFGIGLNPKARLTGLMLEDEKAAGTVHIAFGQNTDMIGGQNNSMTHRDFLFTRPDIVTDSGEVIMKNGILQGR
ncbi:MAG TPA: aminopeptidase [Methanocellaceae archaeon]